MLFSNRPTVVGFLSLALIVACAKPRAGTQDAYQPGTDYCSKQFVSDYNSLAMTMNGSQSAASLTSLETRINGFQSKYAGVNCKAEVKNLSTGTSTTGYLNANAKSSEWLGAVKSRRATLAALDSLIDQSRLPQTGTPSKGSSNTVVTVMGQEKKIPFRQLSDQIHSIVVDTIRDLKASGAISYDFTEADQRIGRQTDVTYKGPSKDAFLNEVTARWHAQADGYLSDFLVALVSQHALSTTSTGWLKDSKLAHDAYRYFEKTYGVNMDDVQLAYGDMASLGASDALGLFVVPKVPSIESTYKLKTKNSGSSVGNYNGEYDEIEFGGSFEVRHGNILIETILRKVFGSPYIVHVNDEYAKNLSDNEVNSVFVHELRHYLDYRKNPDFFPSHQQYVEEHNRLMAEANPKRESEGERAKRSSAATIFVNRLKITLNQEGLNKTDDQIDIFAKNAVINVFNQLWARYSYFNSKVEHSAYREQFHYLRTYKALSFEDASDVLWGVLMVGPKSQRLPSCHTLGYAPGVLPHFSDYLRMLDGEPNPAN